MKCPECSANNADGSKFCSECGTKFSPVTEVNLIAESAVIPDQIPVRAQGNDIATFKSFWKKHPVRNSLAAGLVAVLIAIGVSFGVTNEIHLTELRSKTLEQAYSASDLDKFSPSCKELVPVVMNKNDLALAKHLKAVAAVTDPRGALSVTKAPWFSSQSLASPYQSSVADALEPSFKRLLASSDRASSASTEQLQAWRVSWGVRVLLGCNLGKQFSQVSTTLTSLETEFSRLSTLAESAPWYPVGYSEYDATFAYKWVKNASDDCWGCSYWTIDVVTSTGCPNGVYVELNVLNGDTVIDWTNDTLSSLSTSQVGRMQFETYNDNAKSAQITDMTCHS